MRGNPRRVSSIFTNTGSIPACAGEPLETVDQYTSKQGLSPRVRGNRSAGVGVPAATGSIPACAGEPVFWLAHLTVPRVYPRVCGGTGQEGRRVSTVAGLSPRVRGNRERPSIRRRHDSGVYPRVCGGTCHRRLSRVSESGSIPACAGEPNTCCITWSKKLGLSPRVRGNHTDGRNRIRIGRGSIPACAGEPGSINSRSARERVYPRVCGGTGDRVLYGDQGQIGVYPRVCGGTSIARCAFSRVSGSIPACAGEPLSHPERRPETWVYPRVCGGTAAGFSYASPSTGLSPRVRGNHAKWSSHHALVGSIPACAGEPIL